MSNPLNPCQRCSRPTRYGLLCVSCEAVFDPPAPKESTEGVRLATWLRARDVLFLHVPNGAKSTGRNKHNMKAQGLSPGAPDYLIFDTPAGMENSLWCAGTAIELKQRGGQRRAPSKAQHEWHRRLAGLGWIVLVCHGADEVIERLTELGY
jgi:hypothetical protein